VKLGPLSYDYPPDHSTLLRPEVSRARTRLPLLIPALSALALAIAMMIGSLAVASSYVAEPPAVHVERVTDVIALCNDGNGVWKRCWFGGGRQQ
jgi:hypothetical protein